MTTVPGYTITSKIYRGAKSRVYRGHRQSDSTPVVIKILNNKYPSFQELVLFKNQYTIAKNLNLPGIIKLYCLENYGNSLALIMEDFGGISLADYQQGKPLEFEQFFPIAIAIVQTLEGLYQQRVIHKDIKPQNILIHPQTLQVKLIDFSISSLLPKETPDIASPQVLEGTLAYMSPEQTGRMNRGIDYRTDFYSLGVTFYELLTGELPFQSNDPMELIHCHIAKKPAPPLDINPQIPPILNDIILKLMAKTAEERYQSAFGIKHDLETCWQQWQKQGVMVPFKLGKWDVSDRFVIPEKLYGRETEVATLLAAFERVANGAPTVAQTSDSSGTEMMLVAGFSGIGKTAVVNEVHKPIVRQRGHFIRGKFDQFQRNIPFSALVQAFQSLVRQLLTESATRVEIWKGKILSAVGENGQVLIDLLPDLEGIIGQQVPVSELSGTAAQNRFNSVLQKFIQVFTTPEHPLVIFLDDLQWVDAASLSLIQLLMRAPESHSLLLIGAYRDNEVNPAHPLMLTLDTLRKSGAHIHEITLAPLTENSLNQLIADTLICSRERAMPLTELIHQKTKGNPFFATQFLKSLHEEKLISFDFNHNYWQCDLAKVKALSITEDVVEFMALQLQKLPVETQDILKLAACIGNPFDLATLAIISEQSQMGTAVKLWKALQEGLILPVSDIYKLFQEDGAETAALSQHQPVHSHCPTYKFLHDRVQQAAYFLIPKNRKPLTHLKIGQLLLHHIPEKKREEKIFDIVNQLNIGSSLLKKGAEKCELAQLNLIAGQKAKASTAYAAAMGYLTKGRQLLAPDSWQTHYDLTLGLFVAAAEVAYLNIQFEEMETLAAIVLQNAQSLLDQVKVYEVQLSACTAQVKPKQAVEMGLEVLRLLGVQFPASPTPEDIQNRLAETADLFRDKTIADFVNLPAMVEPEPQAALRILSSLVSPAYITAPAFLPLIILEMVHLSVRHGNAPLSTFAYGLYGLILSGILQDINTGYELGQLALNLLEKLNATDLKTKIFYTVAAHLLHGKHHFTETLPLLKEGYFKGLETGELELGYSAKEISQFSYLSGQDLAELAVEIAGYSKALMYLRQEAAFNYNQIIHQAVLNLLGKSENPCRFLGEAYHEEKMLPFHIQANDRTGLHYFYFHKLIICYLFGEDAAALENAIQAEQCLDAVTGMVNGSVFYFYDSLARLSVAGKASPGERAEHLLKVKMNQEKMQNFADHAPMNFLHKFYLVEAEKHRVLGENLAAMEAYDYAIALAKEHHYLNEEALAHERAAKFYLDWGKKKIAQLYLIDAYYHYARWGAKAKIEDLEKQYPQFLTPILQRDKISQGLDATLTQMTRNTITSTGTGISEVLDLSSVLKASQVISGEIVLGKLLSTLMQVVIENAGASKSALILLNSEGNLVIEAMADSHSSSGPWFPGILMADSTEIPQAIIHYVYHTTETLVLDNVSERTTFTADSYIQQFQPKSVLCMPLRHQGKIRGILYLENNLIAGAFTEERLEILRLLCSQAAISLDNARLYQKSQNYSHQLEQSLQQLQQAQLQLIQSEKMSALGQLVAGVAHEINNPLGFISSNLSHAEGYIQDVLNLLDLYQQKFPNPGEEIGKKIQEIELDYVRADLPDLISSMRAGSERIQNISTSLRTFSRADTAEKVAFNIHEGIDSTLLILKHRLKATDKRAAINIIKEYGKVPLVSCYPGQLNQVFMNILANAIDALDEQTDKQTAEDQSEKKTQSYIKISTTLNAEQTELMIQIQDNGPGMSDAVKQRVFDHLFTTKSVGKGTGLGLSISRQIVEQKHKGQLRCSSVPGQGSEFTIVIPLHS